MSEKTSAAACPLSHSERREQLGPAHAELQVIFNPFAELTARAFEANTHLFTGAQRQQYFIPHPRSTRLPAAPEQLTASGADSPFPAQFTAEEWGDFIKDTRVPLEDNFWTSYGLFDEVPRCHYALYYPSTLFGQADTFHPLWLPTLPVGEYGEDFTMALLHANSLLMGFTHRAMDMQATEIARTHQEVLVNHTIRAASDYAKLGHLTLPGAVKATLEEGELSVMQATALLTAQRIEGFDDPFVLLRALTEQNMIEKLTRIIPAGIVGPLAIAGGYLPDLLVNDHGKLRFHEEAIEYFALMRGILRQHTDAARARGQDAVLGLTCPAAFGGIKALSLTQYKSVEAIRQARAGQVPEGLITGQEVRIWVEEE